MTGDAIVGSAATLVIHGEVSELRRMSAWLREACSAASMPEELIQRMELCANEAVANVISYAYEGSDGAAAREIILESGPIAGGMRLVIRDDGRPFDPLAGPGHSVPASLADAEIGGLGIHLFRKLMSSCTYRREGGSNVLELDAIATPPARAGHV